MYNKTRQYINRKFNASQHSMDRSISHLEVLAEIYYYEYKNVADRLIDITSRLRVLIDEIDNIRRTNNL